MPLAYYGFVGLAIVLVALFGLALYMFRPARPASRQRLEEIGDNMTPNQVQTASQLPLHQRWVARLDVSLRKTKRGQRLQRRLESAAAPLTPGQFVLLSGAAAALSSLLGWLLRSPNGNDALQTLFTSLILATVASLIPSFWLRRREKRRAQQFTAQLPDTLRVIIGGLRVGYSLAQAFETVSELAPEPTRTEFLRVTQEISLGRSLPDTMKKLAERMDNDEVQLMVVAINISFEVGGNLITILDTTSRIIRERTRLTRDVQVLNAQQIMTGNLLMVLPVLVGGLLYLINADYMRQLFSPGPTLCFPVGAVMLMMVGFVLVRRILAIKV